MEVHAFSQPLAGEGGGDNSPGKGANDTFRGAFAAEQRGVDLFRTFNEGEAVVKPSGMMETRSWTIYQKNSRPRAFAFLWQRFEIAGLPVPMLACVMVAAPSNEFIRRTIKSAEAGPRMPAILGDDGWATWIGEDGTEPAAAKALLTTIEGVNWTAVQEPKKPKARKS